MALTNTDIDLGGNNLHVNDIYYGANSTGAVGTKLDSSVITSLQQPGSISVVAKSCNMNATNGTDIATFAITLPTGYTRYFVSGFYVTNASHTMTTAYLGLFTAASAGGTALTSGTTSGINLTNTSNTDKTALNSMAVTMSSTTNPIVCASTDTPLYANLVTQEGTASTADLTVVIVPIP